MLLALQPLLNIKFTGQEESNCHGHSGTSGEPEETASTQEPDLMLQMCKNCPHISGEETFEGQGDAKELL